MVPVVRMVPISIGQPSLLCVLFHDEKMSLEAEDMALLIYTSGTTGAPKAIEEQIFLFKSQKVPCSIYH